MDPDLLFRARSRPYAPRGLRQQGFGLVAAMFLIIVIAGVIAAGARMAVTQTATNSLSIQQARAYQAARAGIEWGIARAMASQGCSETFALDGFSVAVSCQPTAATHLPEEGHAVVFLSIQATAAFATADSPDYAFRQVNAVVEKEN
jgi:MSHA biogenesis protein MshP